MRDLGRSPYTIEIKAFFFSLGNFGALFASYLTRDPRGVPIHIQMGFNSYTGDTAMNLITKALGAFTLLATSSAHAALIDFVDLTENAAGLGESAWNTLSIMESGITTSITATKGGNAAFAYLDWNHAGLGVCGSSSTTGARPGNSGNVCQPASDDNVTSTEELSFIFDIDVVIEKIWLNNTHDPNPSGQIINPETVLINGVSTTVPGNGYATGNAYNSQANLNANVGNFLGSFNVAAGTAFTIGYGGDAPEQFYVSGIEFSRTPPPPPLPVPSTVLLMGAGLLGLGLRKRRSANR